MKKVLLPQKSRLLHDLICWVMVIVLAACEWHGLDILFKDYERPQVEEDPPEIVETVSPHILTDAELSLLYSCKDEVIKPDAIEVTVRDAELLMKLAICEGGEDIKAQALIMRIVFNRLDSENFPNSIEKIINQTGQFSTVSNGSFKKATPNVNSHYALYLIESGWDESKGALFFEAAWLKDSWQANNKDFLFEYDGTRYYK